MALDYHKCAQEIVDNIGGRENVVSAAHCATRLRLVIADNSKVNDEALENIDGVKGKFESNGQLQLIIGTGTVNKVYDEFLAITGMTAATKDDVKAAAAAKQPLWRQAIKTLGDVFVPILPAIVASGLLMGIVEALGRAIPAFASSDWYGFLDTVSNTAFSYLPVIVAVSAARVFGGNIFLGAVIGLLMIHSSFLNAYNTSDAASILKAFGTAGDVTVSGTTGSVTITGSTSIPVWHLIGNIFNVRRVGYQGHVIPIIIAIFIMSKLEGWLHKHVPEMIDLFVTPLTTVFVTAFVTLTVIGPIFSQLETWVLAGARILVKNPIGACIMGGIYPWTVVMGLHHMYNIIEAGMLAETRLNTWMPIASAANIAQFGACLAVALKTKNQKTKAVALPSSLSAALGITEPAIFGVNLRFFKPFICGMIGGMVGSIFAALSGIGASAYGVTGLPGYLTINNYLVYTIELVVSAGIAFVLTTIVFKEDAPKKKASTTAAPSVPAPTNVVISCEAGEVTAPAIGEVVDREQIPDDTFASGVLGDGVGIKPVEGIIFAPFDGTITSVAESKHAIGLSNDAGMEVLIHVGVDTVAMNGDGFEPNVAEGDKVTKGQVIMEFDREKIAKANHPDIVVVLLTNSDDYNDVKTEA